MQPTIPELDAPQIRVAEDQPEYEAVTVALVNQERYWKPRGGQANTVVMAFRPSDLERQRIAEGADVYVALLTFGTPQQPILLFAGADDAAECLGVATRPQSQNSAT